MIFQVEGLGYFSCFRMLQKGKKGMKGLSLDMKVFSS